MMTRPRKNIPMRNLQAYGRTHAVRLADFDYASDAPIHLTLCADRGSPFADARLAAVVCDSVERCCKLCGYALFGVCLMPDHLHVLLSPGESGIAVRDWLRRFKSFTTNEFVRGGGDSPLWQRSASDHVCRKEETAEQVLAYIIDNPVRAGLVGCWQDWPWTRVLIKL
jgi:REP element-mobilizing transposase RayT